METVFSAIQPSCELQLGNARGAVRDGVSLQGTYECSFCIVDYHAVTQRYQPSERPALGRTTGTNRRARA